MATQINFATAGTVINASGNSAVVDVLGYPSALSRFNPQNLAVLVRVTAVSGTTPSLTIEVQWSNDGTNFVSAATPDNFTAITAAGGSAKTFPIKGRFARLAYTLTGTTPTETVDISGAAL